MSAPQLTRGRADGPAPGRSSPVRRSPLRVLAVLAAPAVAYFAVRPLVDSDAVALAVVGATPLLYNVVLVLWRHRIDAWALLSGVGYAVGCLVSLIAGGSALPLKLHEAAVTFLLGLVLLTAVLLRRPLPAGRLLRVPAATRRLDATLGVMVGGFLVLHALIHLALAVSLSTPAYLIAGRIVNWTTIGIAAACLYGYLRRIRRQPPTNSDPHVDGEQ